MTSRRPFYETIVDEIKSLFCTGPMPVDEVVSLASRIKATKISKNHDAIRSAWFQLGDVFDLGTADYCSVIAYIDEQKQEAEAKTAKNQILDEGVYQPDMGGGESCMAIERALQYEKVCPSDPLRPRSA